jgi:hypothetical protein
MLNMTYGLALTYKRRRHFPELGHERPEGLCANVISLSSLGIARYDLILF